MNVMRDARSKPIKPWNLSNKNVQTFSFRAGGFRTPGPTRVFRGHTPRSRDLPSRQPWAPGWYNPCHAPGEGAEGLAAHPWQSAVRLFVHHFWRHQGDVFPLSVARAAMRGASLKRFPVPLQLTLRPGRLTATQRDQSTQGEHAVRMRGLASADT